MGTPSARALCNVVIQCNEPVRARVRSRNNRRYIFRYESSTMYSSESREKPPSIRNGSCRLGSLIAATSAASGLLTAAASSSELGDGERGGVSIGGFQRRLTRTRSVRRITYTDPSGVNRRSIQTRGSPGGGNARPHCRVPRGSQLLSLLNRSNLKKLALIAPPAMTQSNTRTRTRTRALALAQKTYVYIATHRATLTQPQCCACGSPRRPRQTECAAASV